jgi:DNA-3-methyladenine glycosylase I
VVIVSPYDRGAVPEIEVVVGEDGRTRCWWCGADPLYVGYHDDEWGRPVVDDVRLFEKLCLEGFQAGLSWITILRKRERFREVFEGFDPETVARFGAADVERLMGDAGIVRNRAKIEATIDNARRFLELQDGVGSLGDHVWSFAPLAGAEGDTGVRATSPASVALSKDLKRRGWRFVGPTTVHAFLQAMGLVNEHADGCWARVPCSEERAELGR